MPQGDGLPDPLPPPGLRGDYASTCVVCLRGTDTGIGLSGRPQFIVAVLHLLGVPLDAAKLMIQLDDEGNLHPVPAETQTLIVQLCSACAAQADISVSVGLIPDGVPFFGEPGASTP